MQVIRKMDVGDLQLQVDDVFEGRRGIEVYFLCTSQKAHAGEQADQSEVVVAMKVRNENMVDLAAADLVFGHLHLGAFAAVKEKELVFHRDHLCGGMTIKSR